jgi:hypothetical protein
MHLESCDHAASLLDTNSCHYQVSSFPSQLCPVTLTPEPPAPSGALSDAFFASIMYFSCLSFPWLPYTPFSLLLNHWEVHWQTQSLEGSCPQPSSVFLPGSERRSEHWHQQRSKEPGQNLRPAAETSRAHRGAQALLGIVWSPQGHTVLLRRFPEGQDWCALLSSPSTKHSLELIRSPSDTCAW